MSKFIEWWKSNSKWYRSEYRRVWIVFQLICWLAILFLTILNLFFEWAEGLQDPFIAIGIVVIFVAEAVSLTIYLVDLHESKISKK